MFQQPTTSDQRPIRAVVARILDFQEVSKAHSSGAPVLFVNARASSPRGFDAVALKSSSRPMPPPSADSIHKLKVAQKELKESRVWLLFAARLFPGDAVESLQAESRELLLMIGKSINTASARMQGKAIGA